MKIGDKVRFLFDTGGGKIAKIQGNIVYVEDEDGFQIPTPIGDVVVESSAENYSTAGMVRAMQRAEEKRNPHGKSVKALINDTKTDDDLFLDEEPADKEVTFKKAVEERKGGNLLSVYLAFVPEDIKQVTSTKFETYLINDCNYHMHFVYMSAEGNSWQVRSHGILEPNTKHFIEGFTQQEVCDLSRVCVQLLPFKEDKPFTLKPAIDIQMRIDQVKFYKLHTFLPNDFFDTPALLYPIVENDKLARSLNLSAHQLKEEMYAKPAEVVAQPAPGKAELRTDASDAIVIDLHAEKLLDNTGGMSSLDILEYQLEAFRKVMKEHRNQKGRKIVFIHGKGEGVLRQALIHELNYRYKPCKYQDASFQEYGYGATLVTIR